MSQVLDDFLEFKVFARQVNRHPRTVRRWMRSGGLPFTRLGNRLLIHVPSARAWILSRGDNFLGSGDGVRDIMDIAAEQARRT
jgi:excisionase family DNA binding protein